MIETGNSNLIFSSAKEVCAEYSEIIKLWEKGHDPFKRALAKTILEAAGVGK